jgi:GxxExxY protein
MEKLNIWTEQILKYAFHVHSALGPGLLESSYKECLFYELNKNGIITEKEKSLPLIYQEIRLEIGYRVDLLVEGKIIVEIKAVDALADIHTAQVLTYLKLSGCRIGLLLNFHSVHLKMELKD